MTSKNTEVAIIGVINPVAVFVGIGDDGPEATARIEEVESKARSQAKECDPSTEAGRKDLISIAYNVSKTKTGLVSLGKGLTETARAQIKLINGECNTIESRFDDLRDEIRKPVTEFENKEKDRVSGHEDALAELGLICRYLDAGDTVYAIEGAMAKIVYLLNLRKWEEFEPRASKIVSEDTERMTALKIKVETANAEKAELERLRKADEERQQKEHDERIAKEAADQAKAKAEEKAEAERIEAQDTLDAANAKAAREKEAADQAMRDAEHREEQALREKEAAEVRAAKATQDEKDRVAQVKKDEDAATEKRESNQKYKAGINNKALVALCNNAGLSKDQAKAVVIAISSGKIPNIKIAY